MDFGFNEMPECFANFLQDRIYDVEINLEAWNLLRDTRSIGLEENIIKPWLLEDKVQESIINDIQSVQDEIDAAYDAWLEDEANYPSSTEDLYGLHDDLTITCPTCQKTCFHAFCVRCDTNDAILDTSIQNDPFAD